jgi:archaellum component FlaC
VPTERDEDTVTDAPAGELGATEPTDAGGGTLDDVRGVLREIGAEGVLAQLEARLEGLEAELALAEQRVTEAERARRGELDVMRARIEDALAVVSEATTEQRDRMAGAEQRLTGLVEETEAASRELVASLREDLTPRVQQVVHRVDEVVAELRAEVSAGTADLAAELARAREEQHAAVEQIARSLAELRDRVGSEVGDRADEVEVLRARLAERIDEVVTTAVRDRETAAEGREALRRELDAAVGELRATLSLRVTEATDRIELLEQELAAEVEARATRLGELEERWLAILREVVERAERSAVAARETVSEERLARTSAVDEVTTRLGEIAGDLAELAARVDGEASRRTGELEKVTHVAEETARRLESLQSKVASVVRQMASELSNRVATVAADLDTVRTAGVETRARVGAVDKLEARLAALEEQVRAPAPAAASAAGSERLDRIEETLGELRRQLGGVGGQVAEAQARGRELGEALADLAATTASQAALRQDVRDLTVRTSELATRLQATESLARATGQAVATAVRRARGETTLLPQEVHVPPPADG